MTWKPLKLEANQSEYVSMRLREIGVNLLSSLVYLIRWHDKPILGLHHTNNIVYVLRGLCIFSWSEPFFEIFCWKKPYPSAEDHGILGARNTAWPATVHEELNSCPVSDFTTSVPTLSSNCPFIQYLPTGTMAATLKATRVVFVWLVFLDCLSNWLLLPLLPFSESFRYLLFDCLHDWPIRQLKTKMWRKPPN